MTKMNPEVKARWVAALRSGEYKQGMGELRSANECFCCLGVLCDLVDADGWVRDGGRGGDFPWGFESPAAFDLPPNTVREDVGLDWHNTYVVIGGEKETLFDHNDNGRTFAEIADAIEEQL